MKKNKRKSYICIMYHFIDDQPLNKYYVTKNQFLSQLSLLYDSGVNTYVFDDSVPMSDMPRCLITFDDGHKSNLWAARELYKRNMKAVFYLVKDYSLNDPNYLNEQEIKEISDMGHLLGVHGKDHNWWSFKDPSILINELKETKKWIEGITGKDVITCSAVGGVINEKDVDNIRRNIPGLKFIRTSHPGVNSYNENLLNSICIVLNESIDGFKSIVFGKIHKIFCLKLIYNLKNSIKPIYYWLNK